MPQANIATEERAQTITVATQAQAPILGLMNTDLKKDFGSESGDVVSALIPGFGTVGEGLALPANPADYQLSIQKVPLQVTPKNNPASYDFVDASVRLGSFDEKVAKPYGAHLASAIRREAFNSVICGATKAFVVDSLANFKFSVLGEAIAAIEDSNLGGKISGVLSNRTKAAVVNSGLNQFQNGSVAFDLWKGKIQNFDGVDFISQSEVHKFTAPGITGGTVSAAVAEGASQISVTFTGISTATVIPAGYVFNVANVNSVDIFKKDEGYRRAFVVTKPATTSASGAVTLEILPIYATNPALKNATALPAASAAITPLLVSGKTYHTGAIFDQNSVGYASAAIKEAPGCDSATSTIEGMVNVRMTAQYQIQSGINIVRFDILTGGKALYGQGIAGLWIPVN
jgi:hypothetical protein